MKLRKPLITKSTKSIDIHARSGDHNFGAGGLVSELPVVVQNGGNGRIKKMYILTWRFYENNLFTSIHTVMGNIIIA